MLSVPDLGLSVVQTLECICPAPETQWHSAALLLETSWSLGRDRTTQRHWVGRFTVRGIRIKRATPKESNPEPTPPNKENCSTMDMHLMHKARLPHTSLYQGQGGAQGTCCNSGVCSIFLEYRQLLTAEDRIVTCDGVSC